MLAGLLVFVYPSEYQGDSLIFCYDGFFANLFSNYDLFNKFSELIGCSKSTIKILEKDVKYVKNDVLDFVLVFLLLTLNLFHIFF